MLAALAGVLLPLRDIVERPSRAPTRGRGSGWAASHVNSLGGLACLAVAAVVLVFAPRGAVLGVVALTLALLMLLPDLIRVILRLVEWLTLDVKATAPFIAINELRSPSTWSRTVAIAATGAIAVFGSVAIDGTRHDREAGLTRRQAESTRWRESGSLRRLIQMPSPRPRSAMMRAVCSGLCGIRAVRSYRGGFLDYAGRRVWALGPPSAVQRPIAARQFAAGISRSRPLATADMAGGALPSAGRSASSTCGAAVHASLTTADRVPPRRSDYRSRLAIGSRHSQC